MTAGVVPSSAATDVPGPTPQRLVARNRGLDVWPVRALPPLLLLLVWEVVRSNLPGAWLGEWPWRLTVLGVAPTASLAAALTALVAARRQLALTLEPHVGWASFRDASPVLGADTSWRVLLTNSGGGRAIITAVGYRVAVGDASVADQPWVDVDTARATLAGAGLAEDTDFALRRLSPGAGVPVGVSDVEVLALSRQGARQVAAVDVLMTYRSATGDVFERHMALVPREGIPVTSVQRHLRRGRGRPERPRDVPVGSRRRRRTP